jgi:hypothetical protein
MYLHLLVYVHYVPDKHIARMFTNHEKEFFRVFKMNRATLTHAHSHAVTHYVVAKDDCMVTTN